MSIFGDKAEQAVMDILAEPADAEPADEDGITPEGLPEEVAEDKPEAEPAEPEGEAESAAEPEPEPQSEPEPEPAPEPAPETVDKSRYEAAVREMNAKQREAAEYSKRIAELEEENKKLKDSALQLSFNQPQTEEEKAAFYQGLKDNPRQTMLQMISPVLAKMIDDRTQEERQRFDEIQRKQASDRAFTDAYNNMVTDYPQLKDPQQGSSVLEEMFALAENAIGKGPESWRQAPELFLREALIKTYGMPVKIDQDSIEAAKKRGYEEGLAQRQQREAGKAKATPAASTAPEAEAPLTEEDLIRQEIMAQSSGRIFGP